MSPCVSMPMLRASRPRSLLSGTISLRVSASVSRNPDLVAGDVGHFHGQRLDVERGVDTRVERLAERVGGDAVGGPDFLDHSAEELRDERRGHFAEVADDRQLHALDAVLERQEALGDRVVRVLLVEPAVDDLDAEVGHREQVVVGVGARDAEGEVAEVDLAELDNQVVQRRDGDRLELEPVSRREGEQRVVERQLLVGVHRGVAGADRARHRCGDARFLTGEDERVGGERDRAAGERVDPRGQQHGIDAGLLDLQRDRRVGGRVSSANADRQVGCVGAHRDIDVRERFAQQRDEELSAVFVLGHGSGVAHLQDPHARLVVVEDVDAGRRLGTQFVARPGVDAHGERLALQPRRGASPDRHGQPNRGRGVDGRRILVGERGGRGCGQHVAAREPQLTARGQVDLLEHVRANHDGSRVGVDLYRRDARLADDDRLGDQHTGPRAREEERGALTEDGGFARPGVGYRAGEGQLHSTRTRVVSAGADGERLDVEL